ncbi:RagB/SusD family nutrient uptake outer membrane protein [Parapedobacter indicus]|uniref:Starch-binding associating with outer membrane n=1 Tax=Parapedobacter indicus TaxID=1477437 RepID=A0A1I3IG78_9SPHI|nr:RagB/SusD family nutrient uptake outer membrane protein [Parapedobacter indicus]PPL02149.1 putative outer membrane starch-binding protein [Parapedobacter indicus]SFI46803.1 Starch-binding associating with outer membrane [Parapedobacter indicus]
MKRSILHIITCSLVLLSSCSEEFLDRNYPGDLGYDKLYITESDFWAALAGCYQSITDISTNTIQIGELPSDNAYVSRFQTSGSHVDLDRLGFTAQTGIFDSYWSGNFTTIQRVNLLIDKLQASNVNQTAQQKIVAEARFLRAYAYFNLVRVFGGVPLYPEYLDLSKIYDIPRASEEEVFALIIADLQEAANIDSYRSTDENQKAGGRATTVAAKTLLGKVHLWKHDFPAAENVLSEVLTSGKTLVDLDVLYHPDQPFNNEIIFSINYDRASGFGSPFVNTTVPYNSPQGLVYPNVQGQAGSGIYMIEPYVAEKFAPADKRGELLQEVTYDILGSVENNIFSLKYIDPNTTFNSLSGANTIILRYADVLLMYAEALNENGKTEQAYPYVNQVRQRANVGDLPEGLSKPEMFEALANERQKEFLLEGDRWFDLRFRGIDYLKREMNAFMPHAHQSQNQELQVRDAHILFPLPEEQLLIKPVLKQNAGY